MAKKINVTVWNEFLHEKKDEAVKTLYPEGIHTTIAAGLRRSEEFEVRTATLEEPEHGLSEAALEGTDVLFWWSHIGHGKVDDVVVKRVQQHVLAGMGLVVLHSSHFSKIFQTLMGTNCSLKWREQHEKEIVWNIAPNHPITQGLPEHFEIKHSEMYGERFDIPEPDQLIFISWFEGGNVFRSGCTFRRGNGKIFYFAPGHETHPIYHQAEIQTILSNAAKWAHSPSRVSTKPCLQQKPSIVKIHSLPED